MFSGLSNSLLGWRQIRAATDPLRAFVLDRCTHDVGDIAAITSAGSCSSSTVHRMDEDKHPIYAGLCGIQLTSSITICLGQDVTISPTYVHVMSHPMLAINRPSQSGIHHPPPWIPNTKGLPASRSRHQSAKIGFGESIYNLCEGEIP
jgi:hypothetical protein